MSLNQSHYAKWERTLAGHFVSNTGEFYIKNIVALHYMWVYKLKRGLI
jgi:hypothetical protein